jgi:hypothetical protein
MPPMYGSRATQVSRTLRQLAALGWRPKAVCLAPRRGGPHWLNGGSVDPPAGVELVRVPSAQERFAVRALWRIIPPLRDFPDTARVWVSRAAAAARAATADECAGLITFGPAWSSHLVGLRIRQQTGLAWVAHFSDPWADSPYATRRQRSIWRPMEEQVIRESAAVVFVAHETLDLVMAKYPDEWRRKAFVVPHGFEGPLVDGAGGHGLDSGTDGPDDRGALRPLRIVHTGRFYDGLRTPLPVFKALAELNAREKLAGSLEVLFVGPHASQFARDAAALGVAPLVRFQGRVPPAEAVRIASGADVLLVIDAPSVGRSVFLPSKLIEYLPCRKPILGVTPEQGASASLLRRLGCPVAPPDDVAAIASELGRLVERWREGPLEVGEAFDGVAAEFHIARTTRVLHDILIRAFEEHRHP